MIMIKLIRSIIESIHFALKALIVNRLRTLLSLLGITIGIFSVISVFTLVDSLEMKIRSSIESLGSDVVFIQKWPWGFGGEYPWWKYYQRPVPSIDELDKIVNRAHTVGKATFMISTYKDVHFNEKKIENSQLVASSYEYADLMPIEISKGRYMTKLEDASGKNVCIIGADIANELFKETNPISKKLKIFGRKVSVIGVMKKQGQDMIQQSTDDVIIMPVNYVRNILDIKKQNLQPTIIVSPKNGVSVDEMIDDLRGVMRSVRKLKPKADDNFAINKITTLQDNFDGLFATISLAGWFIGGLSLLVGGFGIANIMFVSVKERTKIIGIKKALGAKNIFILSEFLFESVFLSLLGGFFGLLIVFIIVVIINNTLDFGMVLTFKNILLGTSVSFIIGLLAGLAPAFIASRLSPVEAIRTN